MKPRFSAEIINELVHRIAVHNEATPNPRFHVRLGPLKGLYKRFFNGPDPHAHALATIDAHLERQRAHARTAPFPAVQEQARTVPFLEIKGILLPADFRAALAIAGIEAEVGEPALFEAAAMVFYVAHKVISAQLSKIKQIRAVGGALGEIERACLAVSRLIEVPLPPSLPAEDVPEALAHELSRSRDPVVLALLDAAMLDGGEADGRLLADALFKIASLGVWSGRAREQNEVGVKRENISREDPAARSPTRALGFALIETYGSLTSQMPRFSREKPSESGSGKPAGPLIRYLTHLFERARHNLSLDPARAELAHRPEWNPALETVAAWIVLFRRGEREL